MKSGVVTFGYRIENGCIVVNEMVARQIFQFYLEGYDLTTTAKKAGIIFFS